MKRTLLFAILALSFNSYSQSKHPTINLQYPTSNSMENVRSGMEHTGIITSNIDSERNFGQGIKHQMPNLPSLIQIYDSIYNWGLDTLTNGWEIGSKYTNMVYDVNNNLTSETYQIWNGTAWENNDKYTFTYDANNNPTSYLNQTWNDSIWEDYTQSIYTYDANNNQTSETYQIWSDTAWENNEKYTYIYDANYCRISWLLQYWDSTNWKNYFLYTYTYDASNHLISELGQFWVFWNGNFWEDYSLITYTYYANNNLFYKIGQHWTGTYWENDSLTTYTYNASNNLISKLRREWGNGLWWKTFQWLFTYDANNNLVSVFEQQWDGSAWVNYFKDNYTYDANNFTESESYNFWDNYGTNIVSGDSIYYYFHTVVGVKELKVQDGNIVVYPNPASTTITIETQAKGSLSILNLGGQQLLQQEITELKTTIDVSPLKSGIYFVRFTGDRLVQVGKFVKQ